MALLDPAIRVAAGAARDEVFKFVGPERIENLKRVAAEALSKLKNRGATPEAPALAVSIPLLEAARDESRAELVNLWAALLATACDPTRRGAFRNEFIPVVKSLEPHDAHILELLNDGSQMDPSRLTVIASRLRLSEDRVAVSFGALEKLGLTYFMPNGSPKTFPTVTAFGREFLSAVRG